MVNRGEELTYVSFKNPKRLRVVFACLVAKGTKPIHCAVYAFAQAAGIRIGNEGSVKKRIEPPIESMMQKSVAHARLVDITGFGV